MHVNIISKFNIEYLNVSVLNNSSIVVVLVLVGQILGSFIEKATKKTHEEQRRLFSQSETTTTAYLQRLKDLTLIRMYKKDGRTIN